tara:strand:+ start:3538 stop:3798 length:261 start_codon:yes stop_codon:yes gene_type:complete
MYNNLDILFNKAVKKIADNHLCLGNDLLLNLYGLYKQSKFGPNQTEKPKVLSLRQRSKWEAWMKQGNKTKQNAKLEYIDLVNKNLS